MVKIEGAWLSGTWSKKQGPRSPLKLHYRSFILMQCNWVIYPAEGTHSLLLVFTALVRSQLVAESHSWRGRDLKSTADPPPQDGSLPPCSAREAAQKLYSKAAGKDSSNKTAPVPTDTPATAAKENMLEDWTPESADLIPCEAVSTNTRCMTDSLQGEQELRPRLEIYPRLSPTAIKHYLL